MWSNISNISHNFNQSLTSMAKKLSAEDQEAAEEPEVVSQLERLRADRDHFRALATQANAARVELELRVRERDDENDTRRQPGDGQCSEANEEIRRLRRHLIQVEEEYTQEVLESQRKVEELEKRCLLLEEEIIFLRERDQKRDSEFRDIARNETSLLEDRLQTYSASVANLQVVIEQIQKENDRKLVFIESRLERQLAAEREKTKEATDQLLAHEKRFQTTVEALGAASRLSESLDAKESRLEELKLEVQRKDDLIWRLREEVNELKAINESKVDKQVIKGLTIGYFLAAEDRKPDVKRLLARILDFNEEELQRTGVQIGRKKTSQTDDSLSQKFVQFLENESKPEKKSSVDKDIARDLSKSLIISSQRLNPFIGTPSIGSERSSANSSTNDLTVNKLLSNETPFSPVLVSALVSTPEKNV